MEDLRGAKTSQFRDGCITRDAPLALKGHGGGDKRKYGTTDWSEGFNFWGVGEGGGWRNYRDPTFFTVGLLVG